MDDLEFAQVKQRLRSLIEIDLDAYKGQQIRRRLEGYLARLHIETLSEFNRHVARNPQVVDQLRDFLAINVSSFFRDYAKWVDLSERVLPMLERPGRTLSVWSAACSHGAEAYSLAMLLDQGSPRSRAQIQGTDIDRAALHQAEAGGPYTRDEIKGVPPALLATYLVERTDGYYVTPALRARVRFRETDLLRSDCRANFDLIVCRNVLIYFTEAAKQQVLHGLAQALRPGGILFVGATEGVSHEQALGLERVGLSFYRRLN